MREKEHSEMYVCSCTHFHKDNCSMSALKYIAMVYSIHVRLDLVTSLNVIIKMSDNNGSRIKSKIFVPYRCWMDLKSWYVRCVRDHMIMISGQG